MLRVDPQQGVRLAQIITSLHERICEATERGWLGKIEGLQVSLDAARQKMEQIRRTRTPAIPLELSPARHATGRLTAQSHNASSSAGSSATWLVKSAPSGRCSPGRMPPGQTRHPCIPARIGPATSFTSPSPTNSTW
jgi:hypothetical protein